MCGWCESCFPFLDRPLVLATRSELRRRDHLRVRDSDWLDQFGDDLLRSRALRRWHHRQPRRCMDWLDSSSSSVTIASHWMTESDATSVQPVLTPPGTPSRPPPVPPPGPPPRPTPGPPPVLRPPQAGPRRYQPTAWAPPVLKAPRAGPAPDKYAVKWPPYIQGIFYIGEVCAGELREPSRQQYLQRHQPLVAPDLLGTSPVLV